MDGNNSCQVAVEMSESWRRRLRSPVWNDFTREPRPDGNHVAICNHCKRQFSASGRSGTTHLKNHLATCLNTKVRKRRKLVVRRVVLKGDDNGDFFQFDQEASYQDLARMIVYHGYPFYIVHDVGFKAFIKNLQPQFRLISEDAIKDYCMKIYESGRIKLRQMLETLSCRVSLTVDMWRSIEGLEYLCLTCHYVDDDWKLKEKVLNFLHVETPTSAKDISKTIAEKLIDWNLHRKLTSVILDNCNESDMVAKELSEFELLKGPSLLNGEFFHLPTAALMLNVIAQDITGLACDIVSKVRDNVDYVRSSEATLDRFLIAMKKAGISQKPLDSASPNSSWTTTYLMLRSACEYQAAFTCLAECDDEYTISLSSEEWDLVNTVSECLYEFYHAIEKFSEAKIRTSNLFFNDICDIHLKLKTWRASKQTVIVMMASRILENFEQYWGKLIILMAVACVLDPRYKMISVEYFFRKIYDDKDESDEKIENVRNCILNLYNEYVIQSSGNPALSFNYENNSNGYNNPKAGEESKTSSHMLVDDALKGLDQYLQETVSSQQQKSDLELYLDEGIYRYNGPEDNFNILAWWKFHAAKYPILSMMARDILGIPVSAIDGESRTVDQNLSFLDPVTVQGLFCGRDWLKDEFEVQEEPRGPTYDDATAPLPANLDGNFDKCMMLENRDDIYYQKRECSD